MYVNQINRTQAVLQLIEDIIAGGVSKALAPLFKG